MTLTFIELLINSKENFPSLFEAYQFTDNYYNFWMAADCLNGLLLIANMARVHNEIGKQLINKLSIEEIDRFKQGILSFLDDEASSCVCYLKLKQLN